MMVLIEMGFIIVLFFSSIVEDDAIEFSSQFRQENVDLKERIFSFSSDNHVVFCLNKQNKQNKNENCDENKRFFFRIHSFVFSSLLAHRSFLFIVTTSLHVNIVFQTDFSSLNMSSMHPIISSLINNWKNDENRRFHRLFIGILSVCIILIIFANVNQLRKKSIHCKYPSIHLKGSLLGKRRGPPYLTYIISNLPKRLNLTRTSLISRIPFYFNIHHRQPVPHDDLRIRQHGDMNMSSLLLTYVDLWSEFGWKKTDEYNDNDWIFIFEDDVDIVPREIIEKFYGINQTLNSPSLLTSKYYIRVHCDKFISIYLFNE